MRNEVSFYPEIQEYVEAQLRSNFRASNKRELFVHWGIGELKSNLQQIIKHNPAECACAVHFANQVPPLDLDIFALVTDEKKFELLILEIKHVKSVGLQQWSQLVGYCLVSGAKYGLLVNIDNGASSRLTQMLTTEHHLSSIETIVGGAERKHHLGFMEWNSTTSNFEYSNLGAVWSLSELSNQLASEFPN
ncbi:MAG: hypothetical protein FWE41_06095 [Coriobacteriia bacterium]|nr:hypothetical protein [Coriobacteriia bacterium]